jgi:hypothetical protein
MTDSVDEFIGRGRVVKGDIAVADVDYEVRVYRQFIDSRHVANQAVIPGLPHLECTLPGLPKTVSFQDRLTLVMSDGRKLDFYISGSGGSVQPTGPIYS